MSGQLLKAPEYFALAIALAAGSWIGLEVLPRLSGLILAGIAKAKKVASGKLTTLMTSRKRRQQEKAGALMKRIVGAHDREIAETREIRARGPQDASRCGRNGR